MRRLGEMDLEQQRAMRFVEGLKARADQLEEMADSSTNLVTKSSHMAQAATLLMVANEVQKAWK